MPREHCDALLLQVTSSTLGLWLAEEGVHKAAIGIFSLIGLPYIGKFLWAPLFDHKSLPILTRWLGRRRSFMMASQVLLALSLFLLGFINPREQILETAALALFIAFFSACQDIAIDAFRVEILDEKSYGVGAAAVVSGYRLGMLVAGAGALYLVSTLPAQIANQGSRIGIEVLTKS